MRFGAAIKSGLIKYAVFRGRASRSELWWFQLFLLLVVFGLGIVSLILGIDPHAVMALAEVALLLPILGLQVRRLHDVNKSGWWLLLLFIPVVGGIVLLIFYCLKGTSGPNRFGDDPLGGSLDLGPLVSAQT
ncbi:MAG TPA: DUF805 domain-containing protein [Stellaceae bacterium]|nr:DUF805 domain-containing protein [Stellaceae bacterium]